MATKKKAAAVRKKAPAKPARKAARKAEKPAVAPARRTLLGELKLVAICIIACQAAGVVGSFFTSMGLGDWYTFLQKPFFVPPGYVIGMIWIVLFTLMGVSLYFFLRDSEGKAGANRALGRFGTQLALNILWSAAFFGLRSPLFGFIVIVLLIGEILATMTAFQKFSPRAFWLLVPYVAWVSFAAVINLAVLALNK